MSLLGNVPFSSSTATILFGGKEVGQLQNLTWDENHNLRRINEIGSSVPVATLKGVSEYNLRASKAFIDADVVANLLRGATKDELINGGAGAEHVSATGRVNNLDSANDDLTNAVVSALTQGGNIILPKQKVITLFFNIKVQSLSSIGEFLQQTPPTEVQNLETKDLLTFTECAIQSRDASIDVGALVVMQNVSILALHLQYGIV